MASNIHLSLKQSILTDSFLPRAYSQKISRHLKADESVSSLAELEKWAFRKIFYRDPHLTEVLDFVQYWQVHTHSMSGLIMPENLVALCHIMPLDLQRPILIIPL